MITATPARIMNLPKKGRIARGMDADLVVFDEDIRIERVFAKGNLVDSM